MERDGAPRGSSLAPLTVTLLDEAMLQDLLSALLDDRLAGLEKRLRSLAEGEQPTGRGARAPVLLSERELASLLGLHQRTIRRLECNHEIPPSVLVGGSKRWRLRDVEQWLADLGRAPRTGR